MINRPDVNKWLTGLPRHDNSMRERSAKERERQKQAAREQREQQSILSAEREPQPSFEVMRVRPLSATRRTGTNDVERILGSYEIFKKAGPSRINMVGVDQQPPTPAPARQPIHDPSPSPPHVPTFTAPQHQPPNPAFKVRNPPPPPPHAGSGRVKGQPQPNKPQPHHAHLKNGEVKGSLKSGPGPGPGPDGGGRAKGLGLAPLKLSEDGVDPTIKAIMNEMSVKNKVSAIVTTPRRESAFPFPLTPLKDTPVKDAAHASKDTPVKDKDANHTPRAHERSLHGEASKPRQPTGHSEVIEHDLVLSEDSADEEERGGAPKDAARSSGHNGSLVPPVEPPPVTKPPLSPMSSEESSTSDDSDCDSDSSEDSPPPEPAEDKSANCWLLDNFLTKKNQSPVPPGPAVSRPDDAKDKHEDKSRPPPPRQDRQDFSHSSDDEDGRQERHRPALRVTPRQVPSLPKDKSRTPRDSSADASLPAQPHHRSKTVAKVSEKTAKSISPINARETSRKSKKNTDSSKDNQTSAKNDLDKKNRRLRKSRVFVETDSDESLIDVVTTTPEKAQGTPSSRTPKDFPKAMPVKSPVKASPVKASPVKASPVKASPVKASPHASPMASLSSRNSAKRNSSRLNESRSLESLNAKSEDEADKGPKVDPASVLARKNKATRDKDPSDNRKKSYSDAKKASSGKARGSDSARTDKRTASDASLVAAPVSTGGAGRREGARVPASPLLTKAGQNSPMVSTEPKVPIPQVQYENGVARLTCTIPLSFIDKVPKPSENGACSVYSKVDIKQEIKSEVDVKDENRTRGGKGKRKTVEPNTKSSEDKSKSIILTSIFKNKTEQEKVKKEVKSEEDDDKLDVKPPLRIKEEPDDLMIRPPRQRNLSPASDASSTKRKKKKKDKQPDKTPPSSSRDRKRARSTSESNSCDGSEARRSRRDASADSERSSVSRKREHERDSSLESTKSLSRSATDSGEKRSKKARLGPEELVGPDAATSSPSVRSAGSTRVPEEAQWAAQEDEPYSKNTRAKHSQHSSQKDYKSAGDEAGRTQEGEYGEDDTAHPALHADPPKDKVDAASEGQSYLARPSEQDGRRAAYEGAAGGAGMGAAAEAASMQAEGGMVPPGPQRQTTPAAMHATHGIVHPVPEKDYTGYLNRAKELKHTADKEADRSMQAMQYLEAALYFILSAKAMETDQDRNAPLTMYKDTLNFIKWVSSVFRRENQGGGINSKLAVISLRCQSLLSLQIYKMRRLEHKDNQRQLNKYFQNTAKAGGVDGHGSATGTTAGWGGQRATVSPSHLSQTPSPAGSVGSEGSQSSGYTTSNESKGQKSGGAPPVGHTPPHGAMQTVPVPVHIHELIMKQNQLSGHLATAHDMWIEADLYMNGMEDFFQELERHAGPLTLHSSLYDLVHYVTSGLSRLRS